MAIRASGTKAAKSAAHFSIVFTSLCKKYTCPPRSNSRSKASFTTASWRCITKVRTDRRRAGGVAIIDMSRIPAKAIFSVRGIGVAVRVRMSTSLRRALSCSFWRTPKRCSSSIITRPKFLNCTSLCSSLCVPIKMSTLPSAKSLMACLVSLAVLKRLITSTLTGQSAKRSRKLS